MRRIVGLFAATRSSTSREAAVLINRPAVVRRARRPAVHLMLAVCGAILAVLLLAGPAAAEPVAAGSFSGAETAAHEFGFRYPVAADPTTGNAFAFNAEQEVVDYFHYDGVAWKLAGEIKGSETSTGSFGSSATRFNALAIDPANGNLYVNSAANNKVFAFKPNPSTPSGYEEIWENETGVCCGIAVDSHGNPWIGNNSVGPNEVQQLEASTGSFGQEHFVASEPVSLAFDSTDALYVRPRNANGVDKYVAGQLEHTVEPGIFYGAGGNGIAVDIGTDHLYAVTTGFETLTEFDSSGNQLGTPISLLEPFSVAADAVHHRVFVALQGGPVKVFNLPAPVPINVNGKGSVECGVVGLSEPCGTFLPGEVVKLVANAEPGYAFAGWIGCKQTGENTCETTFGENTDVTAIFVKEAQSVTVTPEPAGANCPNGGVKIESASGVEYVCSGTNGANGQNGAQGPEGKQGPQGPAGRVSVTCKVKQKGKKIKVTCTVKQSASASAVHWRLMRAGHAYRHGVARHGRLRLGALNRGHYRLLLAGQKGATEIIVG